jgi:hypothetical protein
MEMTITGQASPEFDLQPEPRILPMLGEINLPQWRCLAEFIDNSVDAFLSGPPVANPEIHISVPTSDSPNARVTAIDTGPGMDPVTLERAVRAGWTSNDPIHNLGMFGMGFNIATARLGSTTRVWTTRRGDTAWHGLEIDFDTLVRQRHFRTPRLSRPKTDPHEHGTEIAIERLKPEQRQWFAKTGNRSKLVDAFETVYSSMLRPNGVPISFGLQLNGTRVRGRSHCIWGAEGNPAREVVTSKYGKISAYQPVRADLPPRSYCVKCWQWLPAGEDACPACDSADNVVERKRSVHGWLGIQRYLSSENGFGIDFIRHGRKIEMANKDLFSWDSGERIELEYPIDDPRGRGRIVGEIHVDHCRVMYTKDRFDRNDPSWDEMVHIVRGAGPLRPDRAGEMGFGLNSSPLSLLFQAFRRNNPHSKVAGAYAKLLIVKDNDAATAMAKRFDAGEADYQPDAKWWALVEEADRELLAPKTAAGASPQAGATLPGFGAPVPSTTTAPAQQSNRAVPVAVPPPKRKPIASLSREYRDSVSGLRWEIRAFDVEPSDPALIGGSPWSLKATTAGPHEFFVAKSDDIFRSPTLTPLDALLAELASSAMDFLRTRSPSVTFGGVLASLRKTYIGRNSLDPTTLAGEAGAVLGSIARSITSSIVDDDARALFGELTPTEQDAVQRKMAARAVRNPQEVIAKGRFLEYAPPQTLVRFVQRHPELFFDGRYWDDPYASLNFDLPSATEIARAQVVSYYTNLLSDAAWLDEQDALELETASRPRLLRAALALELLATESRESTDQ